MEKRILLIRANYPGSNYDYLSFPVGLGYLSEILSREGIEHKIFDLGLEGNKKKLKNLISAYNPEFIGYSFMSFKYKHNYSILAYLKKSFPAIKIIAGGPHISTFKKQTLLDCPEIDIGVMTEGEAALLDIYRNKPLNEIPGIIYRNEAGNVVETVSRKLIDELDKIPFPKYRKFEISKYPKIIPIVTSRGCPHQCIYCPVGSSMGKRFRPRSASGVVDEIEFWYKKGVKDFAIADDVFNFRKDRVYDICDEIESRRLLGLRICCSNGIRADKVDLNLLKRMKRAGFYYLAFGVESANNKVLKTLKKGETVEEIEQAISVACSLGFWVELFFLIGSPGETWENFNQSINLALKYPVCDIKFYNLIPFPDTELCRWAQENNCFLYSFPECLNYTMHHVNIPLLATPQMSFEERKKAFNYAKKVSEKHTKDKKLEFEKWLIKEKLGDYYGIKGLLADFLARLYCKKSFTKIMKLFKA